VNRKILMWIEIALAVVCAVLTIAALIWPTWIESLFEESPDNGSGSAERLIALVWLAGFALFSWLARRERARLVAGRAAGDQT
jgi:hypothetical protein